jgi:hypothetical protein
MRSHCKNIMSSEISKQNQYHHRTAIISSEISKQTQYHHRTAIISSEASKINTITAIAILATPPPAPRMYHAPAWTYNALETMDPPCSLASPAGKQRPYRQGMVEGACGIYPASSTS